MKRLRSSKRKRERNRVFSGKARTTVRQARTLIEAGKIEEARGAVQKAVKALDKAASKGVIHKNNAARRKSRLMRALNEAEEQAS
jgi:small subunit ribosomal protein S20